MTASSVGASQSDPEKPSVGASPSDQKSPRVGASQSDPKKEPARRRYHARDYFSPRVFVMLLLGFSSGLPFMLVGNTFGFWLRDEGIALSLIGFLSWVGIAYSIKFLWAPLLDRLDPPLFARLGRRRGWMALAQILVGLGLAAMGIVGTAHGLALLGACSLLVAFASATQDTVIDAFRIESAVSKDELGLLTSAYTLGYRIALIANEAVILPIAARIGWADAYIVYGLMMAVGLGATFFARERADADAVMDEKEKALPLWTPRGLYDAVAGPFIVFFRTHGAAALLMLAAISLYRLPDFAMGPMANPFYHDLGISKDVIAAVRTSASLVAAMAGVAAGGFIALRFGYMRALLIAGVCQALAIAFYASLAWWGVSFPLFLAVMVTDSFSISMAGISLVAYMSSLTSLGYTATQYALLSSTYALVGKFLKGFSGEVVESLSGSYGLMTAYGLFFLGCGAIGIPSLALFALLARCQRPETITKSAPAL